MITLTPGQMQSIINAAMFEMVKHEKNYKKSLPKAKELYKWLISIDWDEPNQEVIMIDELPF